MKKMSIFVIIAAVLGIGLIMFWQRDTTWSTDDFEACVKAGGTTQESNPPTCIHPNGDRITPGSSKE